MPNSRRRLHFATGNAHKVQEMQALADASGAALEIVAAGVMPAVVEDAGTFVGNARKKALALKALLPATAWVLADDSGLCVDALEGAPGVESAYFAGPAGDGTANLAKLVRVMSGVPDDRRQAHFICVLILLTDREEKFFEGRSDGRISRQAAGRTGFGYDPVFVPAGHDQSFSELPEAEKNKLSHRGRAWLSLVEWLKAP
jgi:XTP/dITP diphosphohydrolase